MIVCNTLTGAVSEYTDFDFQSITPTHGANGHGLYVFGGETDAGRAIVADVRLPLTLRGDPRKRLMESVYLSMRGTGQAQVSVFTVTGARWDYAFAVRTSGVSRCVLGKGLRENYTGFGFSNPQGQPFTVDVIELLVHASQRRL